jgi:hypothetical protein
VIFYESASCLHGFRESLLSEYAAHVSLHFRFANAATQWPYTVQVSFVSVRIFLPSPTSKVVRCGIFTLDVVAVCYHSFFFKFVLSFFVVLLVLYAVFVTCCALGRGQQCASVLEQWRGG